MAELETITANLTALMDSPTFEQVLTDKLESMNSSPLGMMLSMMNLSADKLKPFLLVRVLSARPSRGAGQRGPSPRLHQGDEGRRLTAGSSRRPHPHSADARAVSERLQPFVAGIAKDIGPMLAKYMEGDSLPVLKLREEVEKLMDERLKVRETSLSRPSHHPPSLRCPAWLSRVALGGVGVAVRSVDSGSLLLAPSAQAVADPGL